METKVSLSLSVEAINVVLASLGKMPYESVFTVVEEIRKQATPQIQQQQPAAKPQ